MHLEDHEWLSNTLSITQTETIETSDPNIHVRRERLGKTNKLQTMKINKRKAEPTDIQQPCVEATTAYFYKDTERKKKKKNNEKGNTEWAAAGKRAELTFLDLQGQKKTYWGKHGLQGEGIGSNSQEGFSLP